MKVKKNGREIDMTYEQVCEELGSYNPSVHFVKVTPSGEISFTCGKRSEICQLLRNAVGKGFEPAEVLVEAANK